VALLIAASAASTCWPAMRSICSCKIACTESFWATVAVSAATCAFNALTSALSAVSVSERLADSDSNCPCIFSISCCTSASFAFNSSFSTCCASLKVLYSLYDTSNES
jgi:hypothetical protein